MNVTMKLNHIHIRCQDMQKAEDCYVKVLGGQVIKRDSVPGMPIVRIQLGGQIIALSPPREGIQVEPLSGNNRWGVWQIALEVDDVNAAYEELRSRGAIFKGEPVEQVPGVKIAFMEAPDGVEIELLEFASSS